MEEERWEVRHPRTGAVLSTHACEESAWRAVDADHRRIRRSLNRPGLHGGIAAEAFCEREIVKVTTHRTCATDPTHPVAVGWLGGLPACQWCLTDRDARIAPTVVSGSDAR